MVVFVEQVAEETEWQGGPSGLAFSQSPATMHARQKTAHQRENSGRFTFRAVPKAQRLAVLNQVVLAEILPRIDPGRRLTNAGTGAPTPNARATTYVTTGQFVRLLLAPESEPCFAFIDALAGCGVTAESLYTGILPDAARWLGLLWEEDRVDFALVTIAVGRMQQITRLLSPLFQVDAVHRAAPRSLLLLPAPGEQHTFGLLLLAEFFQRAGWRVAGGPKAPGTGSAELARRTWFDVAGFTIGSERLLQGLAQTIQRVRETSRNPCLLVMVGGPLFEHRPDLVAAAGADAMADNAAEAVRTASALVTTRDQVE